MREQTQRQCCPMREQTQRQRCPMREQCGCNCGCFLLNLLLISRCCQESPSSLSFQPDRRIRQRLSREFQAYIVGSELLRDQLPGLSSYRVLSLLRAQWATTKLPNSYCVCQFNEAPDVCVQLVCSSRELCLLYLPRLQKNRLFFFS